MSEPSPREEDRKPDAEDQAPPASAAPDKGWVERDRVDPKAAGESGPPRPVAGRPGWIVGAGETAGATYGRASDAFERTATPIPPSRPHPPLNLHSGFAPSPAWKPPTSSGKDSGPAPGAGSRPTRPASDDRSHEAPKPHEPGGHDEPEARHADRWHGAAGAGATDYDLVGPEAPDAAMPATVGQKPLRAAPPPPPSPWWEQALAKLSSTTGLIALGVVAVLGILIFAFTRPHQPTVSVGSILRNATRFDGRTVTVHGRVGEVYRVGGGHSFYLMQGRDTIVVFTRTRTPVTHQKVTVTGVVSTGFLNGQPREALLESTP